MGSGTVLASLLSRARAGLRVDRLPLFAGHGVADANFRPARLPYVSITGPLNLELEPERDPARPVHLWAQTPGYLAGEARSPGDVVPPPGPTPLTVVLDGEAEATVDPDLDALAGDPLADGGTAGAVAAAVETALRAAVDAGGFVVDGVAVVDPDRRAELRATTVRWDPARARIVIASGRRGVVAGPDVTRQRPSAVEVQAGALAAALGLTGPAAVRAQGRVVRHERPSPTAVAVDVRVDLWAGSQLDLATTLDAWARITPTRGQLLEQTALLAADAERGDATIRLQPDGETPSHWTLLQLERGGGRFADRLTGREATLAGGAVADGTGLRLDGDATATVRFFDPPPVPYAWLPDRPGRDGYAISLGVRAGAGAAGDTIRVVALEHDAQTVVAVDVEMVDEGGQVRGRLRATGENAAGTGFDVATSTVDAAALAQGVEAHVVLDVTGGVSVFADGAEIGRSATPLGALPGGTGMTLVLGDAGGGGAPAPFTVVHVQVHGRPLGPVDPRLRAATAPASAWSPGDPVCLARCDDGVTPSGEPFMAEAVAVAGDVITLDRPVAAQFPRASTVVYERALFFSQRQLRRQDDLMNALYRISIEYRVSTFLDEGFPAVSAPLVEITDVEVRDRLRLAAEQEDPLDPHYPSRPATGHPGTRTLVVSSSVTTSRPSDHT